MANTETPEGEVGARFYSAKLGRFLSADPLVGVMGGDPQMLDRYAYVRNNPLRYVDPTGLSNTPPPYFAPFDWEKLKQAGEILSSLGVPESSHRGTLLLIARLQKGASPLTPAFYMGSGTGYYTAGKPAFVHLDTGPSFQGMKDEWTGTYSVRVRVDLPNNDLVQLCGCGTGYVYVIHSSDPQDRHIALDVKLDFSSGETSNAKFEGYEPGEHGNPPVGVYSFTGC